VTPFLLCKNEGKTYGTVWLPLVAHWAHHGIFAVRGEIQVSEYNGQVIAGISPTLEDGLRTKYLPMFMTGVG